MEVGDPVHAEVGDREGAAGELGRGDRAVPHACGERPRLGGDLAQALAVGIEDGGNHQGVLGGDRDPDVDPRVELDPAVAIGAVGPGEVAEGERARLHHHVVEGRDHLPLLGRGLERLSAFNGGGHVDLRLQVEMRRSRLRLGHPAGDGLLELRQVDDFDLALGRLGFLGHARGRAGGSRRRGGSRYACRKRLLNVPLDDSSPGPGPAQAGEVQSSISRDPLGDRRRLDAAITPNSGWRGSGRSLRDLRWGRGCGCSGLLLFAGRLVCGLNTGSGSVAGPVRCGRGPGPAAVTRDHLGRIPHPRDGVADRKGVSLLRQNLDEGPGEV